jgi:hypothetical protein
VGPLLKPFDYDYAHAHQHEKVPKWRDWQTRRTQNPLPAFFYNVLYYSNLPKINALESPISIMSIMVITRVIHTISSQYFLNLIKTMAEYRHS